MIACEGRPKKKRDKDENGSGDGDRRTMHSRCCRAEDPQIFAASFACNKFVCFLQRR